MTTITSEVVPSNPSYTPPSYFFPMGLGTYLLATVKGTQRRSSIEKLIEEGSVLDVEDWLAHSSLDDRTRELIGRFHPARRTCARILSTMTRAAQPDESCFHSCHASCIEE